jgi:SRSO17 transposase
VPAAWVTADEVYGQDPGLRAWLQDRRQPYVLAIKRSERLEVGGATAEQLPGRVPADRWLRLSAGDGAKGRRLYDWTRIPLAATSPAGMTRWLLVRRSLRDPDELAFYTCAGPAGTPLTQLVTIAGTRWSIEVGFQTAKGEVGLDHYEVRRWPGWHRHITLALLAHAFLAVVRAGATDGQRGPCW